MAPMILLRNYPKHFHWDNPRKSTRTPFVPLPLPVIPQAPPGHIGKREEQEQEAALANQFGQTPPLLHGHQPPAYVRPPLLALRTNFSGKIKLYLHIGQAKDFEVPMLSAE